MATWRRIRAGSGHRYIDDAGEPVDGVTRIIGDCIPKRALIDAAARETASFTLDHWDELAEKGPADRLRAMERGRFERWNRSTVRGTQVHAFAAQLAAGAEVEVPDEIIGHVDAYLAFIEQWRVAEVAVECMIVNRQWRYAGTIDLLATLGDAQLWLLDWKTGASGIWPETALQLSAYARADSIIIDDVERDMPKIDRAAAVWLKSDGYEVIPVDIGDLTFRTFLYAQQVARFCAQPREATVLDALAAPMFDEEAAS